MPFFPRSQLWRTGRDHDARRREDADGDRALSFELDAYEFVQASDEMGLLRVAGRWVADVDRALEDIALTVDRDGELLQLAPLPDLYGTAPLATPAGETWRGAFTVDVELVEDPRSEFALSAGDEASVALPRPGEWPDDVDEPAMAAPEPVEEEDLEPLPGDIDLDLGTPADELEQELARVRAELREARAEVDVERARRQLLEDHLRDAISVQETRLRSVAAEPHVAQPSPPTCQSLDDDFLDRLDRARRMSETAT
jgi:hypothetical protein